MHCGKICFQRTKIRYFRSFARAGKEHNLAAGIFKFCRYGFVAVDNVNREGNKRRRNGFIHKGTAHAVFAADSRQFQSVQRGKCAQKCCKGLTPKLGIMQFGEVFLAGKAQFCRVCTKCNGTCYRFHNRIQCAVERAPAGNLWVVAARHNGCRRGFAVQHGQSANHAFGRSKLAFAAKRHQHGAAADSAVKTFGKPFLTANIKASEVSKPCVFQTVCRSNFFRQFVKYAFTFNIANFNVCMLGNAVGIQKVAGKVNDFIAAPVHYKPSVITNLPDNGCFKVFLIGKGNKFLNIFGSNNKRHAFLRFGNGKFRTVKAFIFLRHFVKVNYKAVGKFAVGNGYAACTVVVAALNHRRNFRVAEQTLNFTFCRRVAFLYFRTAACQRINGMFFGRTCCAAATVTAGSAAEQH